MMTPPMINDKLTEKLRRNKEIRDNLRTRLEEEYSLGTATEVQKERVFNLAWEYGHAYGENEVESYYRDLVTLFE